MHIITIICMSENSDVTSSIITSIWFQVPNNATKHQKTDVVEQLKRANNPHALVVYEVRFQAMSSHESVHAVGKVT